MIQIKTNEAYAPFRRVYFQCVDATDGMTPELGEAGGQPEVSIGGEAWVTTEIGTLVAIGNGRYYAELTQNAVDATPGMTIETRYKSPNTAECIGSSVQVIADLATSISAIDTSIVSQIRECRLTNNRRYTRNSGEQTYFQFACIDMYNGSTFTPTHVIFWFGGDSLITLSSDNGDLGIQSLDNADVPGWDMNVYLTPQGRDSLDAIGFGEYLISYQLYTDGPEILNGQFYLVNHPNVAKESTLQTVQNQFGVNILNTSPIYYNYGQDANEEIARFPFAYDGNFTDITLQIGGVNGNYIELSTTNGDFGTNAIGIGYGEATLNIHAQGRDALDSYIISNYGSPGLQTLVCRMIITGDAGTVEAWRTLICNLGGGVTLAEIEGSAVLAKEATLNSYQHPYRKINQSPIYHKTGQRSSFPYVGIDDSTGGGFVPTDVTLYLYTDQHIYGDILILSNTHIEIYEQDYFSGEGTFRLTSNGVSTLDAYLADTVEKVCWCYITMTNGSSTASAHRVMICNQGGSGVSLSEIEASTVLAKEGTLNSMTTAMAKETTLESIRATELTNIQNTLNSIEVSGAGEATLLAISGQVADLHNEAFGKWDIDYIAKTLTLYRADNTVLKIFDLTEAAFNSIRPYKTRTPR